MKRDKFASIDLGWKQPHSRQHDPDEGRSVSLSEAAPQFGVIQRGIPVPAKRATGRYHALAQAMQPGDSVLMETKNQAHVLQATLQKRGAKTRRMQMDGGYRVWVLEIEDQQLHGYTVTR